MFYGGFQSEVPEGCGTSRKTFPRAFSHKFPLTLIALNKQDCFNYDFMTVEHHHHSLFNTTTVVVVVAVFAVVSVSSSASVFISLHFFSTQFSYLWNVTTHWARTYRCYTFCLQCYFIKNKKLRLYSKYGCCSLTGCSLPLFLLPSLYSHRFFVRFKRHNSSQITVAIAKWQLA